MLFRCFLKAIPEPGPLCQFLPLPFLVELRYVFIYAHSCLDEPDLSSLLNASPRQITILLITAP